MGYYHGQQVVERESVNFYDLLEGLVSRTPWRTEEEARAYTELLKKLRSFNLFGYLALHETVEKEKRYYE